MKKYEAPKVEIFKLDSADIICTSGGGGLSDGGDHVVGGDDTIIMPTSIPYNN